MERTHMHLHACTCVSSTTLSAFNRQAHGYTQKLLINLNTPTYCNVLDFLNVISIFIYLSGPKFR